MKLLKKNWWEGYIKLKKVHHSKTVMRIEVYILYLWKLLTLAPNIDLNLSAGMEHVKPRQVWGEQCLELSEDNLISASEVKVLKRFQLEHVALLFCCTVIASAFLYFCLDFSPFCSLTGVLSEIPTFSHLYSFPLKVATLPPYRKVYTWVPLNPVIVS